MKNTHKRSNPFTHPSTAKLTPEFEGMYVVYIIGPISSYKNRNEDEFRKAQARLEQAGYHAVIPHEVIDPNASWINAVTTSLIVIEKSDGVVYLDGSLESPEGCIELTAAGYIGKPCVYINEWLEEDDGI